MIFLFLIFSEMLFPHATKKTKTKTTQINKKTSPEIGWETSANLSVEKQ